MLLALDIFIILFTRFLGAYHSRNIFCDASLLLLAAVCALLASGWDLSRLARRRWRLRRRAKSGTSPSTKRSNKQQRQLFMPPEPPTPASGTSPCCAIKFGQHRRAALDAADAEDEREATRRARPSLPEKPEQTLGRVSSLTPKEERQGHGRGMTRTPFYSQAKKGFKAKSVAADDEKAWRAKRKVKGRHKSSWKRPKSNKETPTSRKKVI